MAIRAIVEAMRNQWTKDQPTTPAPLSTISGNPVDRFNDVDMRMVIDRTNGNDPLQVKPSSIFEDAYASIDNKGRNERERSDIRLAVDRVFRESMSEIRGKNLDTLVRKNGMKVGGLDWFRAPRYKGTVHAKEARSVVSNPSMNGNKLEHTQMPSYNRTRLALDGMSASVSVPDGPMPSNSNAPTDAEIDSNSLRNEIGKRSISAKVNGQNVANESGNIIFVVLAFIVVLIAMKVRS